MDNTNTNLPDQQPPNQPMPEKKWYEHRVILAVIVLAFIACISVLAYLILLKPEASLPTTVNPTKKNLQTPTTPPVIAKQSELTIEGTSIYQTIGQRKKILFTNVQNVSEARLGPDGNTVHFKLTTANESNQANCANLASVVTPAEPGYSNPPPSQAPWDYKRVANYATIEGCGDFGQSGGYIQNTNYFVYLKIDPSNTTQLFIENLQTKEVQSFPIDSQIWAQVKNTTVNNTVTSLIVGLKDNKGATYYYPQRSVFITNGKLLVAIGRMAVAIDLAKNKLLGIELLISPNYGIVADSFWFHSNNTSPLILMESGSFVAVFDLSGNDLQVTGLSKYPQPSNSRYKTPLFELGQQNLLLHFYKETEITNQVSKQDLAYFQNELNPPETQDVKNSEIQTKLMNTGKYIEVQCELPGGMGPSGCWTITKGNEYQVTPGQGISVIK